jgi:hypothetical protein
VWWSSASATPPTINRLRRRPEVRSTRTTVIMEAIIDRPPTTP